MSAGIVVPAAVHRAIVMHASRERPRECCGFLVGAGRRVVFAVATTNTAPGTSRYRVDDREHLELRRVLRGFAPSLVILGVYHSHPAGPPVPSPTDVAEAHYPEWVHLIVSLAGVRPRIGAYRIAGGRVSTVPVSRVPR